MADYKNRRRARRNHSADNGRQRFENIDFAGKLSPQKRNKPVKKHNAGSYIFIPFVCIVLVIAYLIILTVHPVGVIEYLKSEYNSIGYGDGYNIDFNDGKPLYTLSGDNKYFVISASSVNCYNKNGKIILEKKHSLSEPVVKYSETRYLLYGQGERTLLVNTFSDTLYTKSFSSGIITAAISDSGTFAVASKADGYSSSVSVFDKSNKKIYEWFSSDETVNSLAVSPNGNSVAVSTIKVEDGKYLSNFYVLKFNSADAVIKKSYTDDVIYQIYSTSNTTYCATLSDNIEFINYKNGDIVSHKSDYSVNIVKLVNNKIVAVRTVAANQDESVVEVYKPNGKLTSSFKVNSYITDFSYRADKIYLLGLHDIYKYNLKGELKAETQASYDALFIESVSANSVACIRNSSIDKCTLTLTEAQ